MPTPATDMAVELAKPAAAEQLARIFPGRAFVVCVAPGAPGQQCHVFANLDNPGEIGRLLALLVEAVRNAGGAVAPAVEKNLLGGGR